jgi:hypothetical protein
VLPYLRKSGQSIPSASLYEFINSLSSGFENPPTCSSANGKEIVPSSRVIAYDMNQHPPGKPNFSAVIELG